MLKSVIVPNDTREHVVTILKEILLTPGRSLAVRVIFTDDVAKDKNHIVQLFKDLNLQVSAFISRVGLNYLLLTFASEKGS